MARKLLTSLFAINIFIIILIIPYDVSGQHYPLWNDLEPGSHNTGFQRIWTLDSTRIYPRSSHLDSLNGNIFRPIRIDFWYPAECESKERMPLRDYVFMDAPTSVFEDLVFLTERWDEYSYRGLAEKDSSTFNRLMSVKTAACKNAQPAAGRFPLILYSAGWFNRAPDNTILAEYLASHGFVVATVPQLNPGLWTFNFQSDAVSVENQIRDLEFALGLLSEKSFVDRRLVASMGNSTGGDVALLLQGRNPLIDTVVGLDASWTISNDNDVIESPFFSPKDHTVPLLAIRRPTDNSTSVNKILDSLQYANRIIAEIPGGDHGSFSDDPSQRKLLGLESSSHYITHQIIARTVLDYLKAFLSGSSKPEIDNLVETFLNRGLNCRYEAAINIEQKE